MMGDLLESLVWGAKSEQYSVIGGGSLHIHSYNSHEIHFRMMLTPLL